MTPRRFAIIISHTVLVFLIFVLFCMCYTAEDPPGCALGIIAALYAGIAWLFIDAKN